MSGAGRVGWRNKKRMLANICLPSNGFSILPMRVFTRRHTGHDLRVEKSKSAQNEPSYPKLIFYLGVFVPPLVYIYIYMRISGGFSFFQMFFYIFNAT